MTQAKAGRPAALEGGKKVAAALRALEEGTLSRYLTLQLVERGMVEVEAEKTGTVGRPRLHYRLSGKGRGFLALAAKWK